MAKGGGDIRTQRVGKDEPLMAIMGFSGYEVVDGEIFLKGKGITRMPLNERANQGIGLSFQRPPTIKGVRMRQMLEICGKGGKEAESMAQYLNFD